MKVALRELVKVTDDVIRPSKVDSATTRKKQSTTKKRKDSIRLRAFPTKEVWFG